MTRLVIVEDHAAIGQGLAALIATSPDFTVVGIAANQDEAAQMIEQLDPDAVLCDIMLNGRDAGFDLLVRYHQRAHFVMFTAYDFPSHHARAVAGGAAGYLSKTSDTESILAALRRVAAGRQAFPREVLRSAQAAPRPPTTREMELLGLLVNGASNELMAERLGLKIKTIEGMIRRLFHRYGVDNRTQLARLTQRQGWLTSGGASGGSPAG